jgi:ribonuclease Z
LFDAGDGAAALLEGKIHKANVIVLTHAHRDHIAGLPQLLNLRAGMAAANGEPLRVYHPDGSGSLLAFSRFLSQFDQMTAGRALWQPLRPGDRAPLDDSRFLRAYATHHIPCTDPARSRSLGYQIGRSVERLKPELRGMPQAELDRLRSEGGRAAITAREEEILLTVSGDTVPMPAESIRGTRFLLHECTFMDNEAGHCDEARDRGHEHSCLNDVLDLAQEAQVQHLGLYHISKRYTDEDIVRTIRAACARRDLKIKVSVALPGRVQVDLFSQILWPPRAGAS